MKHFTCTFTANSTFDIELDQRAYDSVRRPNLPLEQTKREALVLTVQTGQAAKYRSAQQTVSKPSSHN